MVCTQDVEECISTSAFAYDDWWKQCQVVHDEYPFDELITVRGDIHTAECQCDETVHGMNCISSEKTNFQYQCPSNQICFGGDDNGQMTPFLFSDATRGCVASQTTTEYNYHHSYQYYCLQPHAFACQITELDIPTDYSMEAALFQVPFGRTGPLEATARTFLYKDGMDMTTQEDEIDFFDNRVWTYALYVELKGPQDNLLYMSDRGLLKDQPKAKFTTKVLQGQTNITLQDKENQLTFGMTCKGLLPSDTFLGQPKGATFYRDTCAVASQVAYQFRKNGVHYFAPQQEKKQQQRTAILSACFAGLSIFGSMFIVFATTYRWRKLGTSSARDRILMGMSGIDIISSSAIALGPLPSPKGAIDMIGAVGNTATCSAQGFAIQLGFAVPLYNAALAVSFLLLLRQGYDAGSSKRLEALFHLIPLGFAFVTAVYGVANRIFNSNGSFCYVESFPYNCSFDLWYSCDKGRNFQTLFFAFAISPAMTGFLVTIISLGWMSVSVYRQSRKLIQRYGRNYFGGASLRAKLVLQQSAFYIAAYMITYVPFVAEHTLRHLDREPDWLWTMYRIMLPLQGFWNFFIFIRPSYMNCRKQYTSMWPHQAMIKAMKRESIEYTVVDNRKTKRMSRIMAAARQSRDGTSSHHRNVASRSYSFDSTSLDSSDGTGLPKKKPFLRGAKKLDLGVDGMPTSRNPKAVSSPVEPTSFVLPDTNNKESAMSSTDSFAAPDDIDCEEACGGKDNVYENE
jgi:hypothetical protein